MPDVPTEQPEPFGDIWLALAPQPEGEPQGATEAAG